MDAVKNMRDLKKGELFRLKAGGAVYVRGEYERALKKYSATRFDDINAERFMRGAALVLVGFTY